MLQRTLVRDRRPSSPVGACEGVREPTSSVCGNGAALMSGLTG